MGVVWRAVDSLIGRRVAVKEVRPPGGEESSSFVERALREARNAGRLSHPGVVAVHDVVAPVGGDDDAVYIVMEYVDGPTLADVVDREGALPAPRVAAIGLEVLEVLVAAHGLGVVHRDVKPSNVLVPDGGRVKLGDFGIALAAEDSRLTRSGVVGTQGYMAPECFDAGPVGPAADLWGLGATLFQALTGRPPFERDTTTATLRAILFEDPPAPPCGSPLGEVISGLLTRPVDQRLDPDTARDLLQQAVTMPASPTTGTPTDAGAGWEARATTVHRPPALPPTPAPWAQPSPHTTQPGQSGPGAPSLTTPSRPSRTPWIVGGALAVAAAVGLAVVLASGGDGGDQPSTVSTHEASTPDPADGVHRAQEFLDAVNDGDDATAVGMLCSSAGEYAHNVTLAVDGDASLELGGYTLRSENVFQAHLTGTIDGAPSHSGFVTTEPDGDDWCVATFHAEPDTTAAG